MGIFDFLSPKKDNGKPNNLLELVEVTPGFKLPRAFVPAWPEIEKMKLPLIKLTATPSSNLSIQQSKLGHYPCLPKDFDYPIDADGKFMYPLAQINFSELPKLDGYPTSGYLQFYINGFDDIYGRDYNDNQSQKNFRILFFEEHEVENHKTDFSFLDEVMNSNMIPMSTPHSLTGTLKEEYLGINDARYLDNEKFSLYEIAQSHSSIANELDKFAYTTFPGDGHRIGGYATFTQEDPRIDMDDTFDDYILLLQVDTDDHIMWGDAGVANFFIHPDDLAKKDFSKVMYNWDCC